MPGPLLSVVSKVSYQPANREYSGVHAMSIVVLIENEKGPHIIRCPIGAGQDAGIYQNAGTTSEHGGVEKDV